MGVVFTDSIRARTRTAFTLIEVVIAVLILGIAVPPTLNMMESASSGRVDSINTTRATFLATIVLESIFADMTSQQQSLGFDALADNNAYLNTPTTGLYARLEAVTSPYTDVGLDYKVAIGALVSSDGTVSVQPDENVFRIVTVNVAIQSASGQLVLMPVSMMLSEM